MAEAGISEEDSLPKVITQLTSFKGNQPEFQDGKHVATSECVSSQQKLEVQCFVKADEIVSSSSAAETDVRASSSGMSAETVSTKRRPSPSPNNAGDCGPSPKRLSSQTHDPGNGLSTSLNVSFGQLPSPRITRRSWRRSSLKQGTNRRKSLPPLYADVTELSQGISLDLPEIDRMKQLLLSSFRYSAQKLEQSLRHTEGFNPDAFEEKVNLVSEELRHCTKRLELDGTLQKCIEGPGGGLSNPALAQSIAVLKETINRFSEEHEAWDQLLLAYQTKAEELSRQLQQWKLKPTPEESLSYFGTSQAHVLQTKPDYQKILDCQREVFDCLELMLDGIQQTMKICHSYIEDNTTHLQKLSVQLASKTFQRLENSPARKLLSLPQRKLTMNQAPDG